MRKINIPSQKILKGISKVILKLVEFHDEKPIQTIKELKIGPGHNILDNKSN